MAASSHLVGHVLGHYRIVEQIGAGGMGVVYRARDEQLERDVAVKVLPAGALADEKARKRFRKEALMLAMLNQPNIETVHEFGSQDGVDFLVTEYISGETLDAKLAAGALTEKEILRLGAELAEGLGAAHDQGMIHRDLKPGNLRLTPDGRLKILDFGIAQLLKPKSEMDLTASLTQSQEMGGTLPYMAPECFRGQKSDARSDIWAVGAVLYEMATAHRPFPQSQSAELINAILHKQPPLPRALNACVSLGLENIILKALDKEPERRYQSARELRVDLKRLGARTVTSIHSAASASFPVPTLEVAHVLFMDIVAYSKLPMDEQHRALACLQKIVRNTAAFSLAPGDDQLIRLPTGDGMALVFFGDAEAAVHCAMDVAKALRTHPEIGLRMGIHTGPVYRVADINANLNVAGGGINLAQRVMDCGDAGHILVSSAMADLLGNVSGWRTFLHDLGEAEVKHGVKVHIYSLYSADFGNPTIPGKIRASGSLSKTRLATDEKDRVSHNWARLLALAAVLVLLLAAVIVKHQKSAARNRPAPVSANTKNSDRTLQYYVIVQKYRNGMPYQEPFRLSGERIFEADYHIRLVFSSPQPGYLYILNEGPTSSQQQPSFNSLFPSPSTNHGLALLYPGQELKIPERGFIIFDKERGTERLWLVWAKESLPELEALKKWVNFKEHGAIRDLAQLQQVKSFLLKSATARASLGQNDANQTILEGKGDVLVHSIKLEHD